LLTIFDLILVYLTWREYLQKKRVRDEGSKTAKEAPKPQESNA
jgi:uncharacterized membrane protein